MKKKAERRRRREPGRRDAACVSPVALGYIVFLMATGALDVRGNGAGHVLLLAAPASSR